MGLSEDRLFSFRCGSSGASVTCLRCGVLVAEGRWPRDVYPKADQHVCEPPVRSVGADRQLTPRGPSGGSLRPPNTNGSNDA